jgi:outer membrane lipoprotein SlyB
MQPFHIRMVAIQGCIAGAAQNTKFAIRPKRAQGVEQTRHHNGVANFVVVRQDEDAFFHGLHALRWQAS